MRILKLNILMLMCVANVILAYSQKNPKQWAEDNYEKYTKQALGVSDATKEKDIEEFRQMFHKKGYRKHQYKKSKLKWQEALMQLSDNGQFKDLIEDEKKCNFKEEKKATVDRKYISGFMSEVWYRLGIMADAVVKGKVSFEEIYTEKYIKSVLYYGNLEISRSNYVSRFHESCFAVPTSAMNIYYAFLDRMDYIESGKPCPDDEKAMCKMLKTVALQAWTQPIRKDETDKNVVSVDRFRHHVWWVGGNGLAYRSLMPVACMIKSIPMMNVLAEVAQKGISCTSQATNQTSFWTEGFTADGAGWGHGMQCLVWGYPIDGTSSALNLLSMMKGSSWERKLDKQNKEAIFNYLRGSNWYYYKGYNLPCLDRHSFVYSKEGQIIKSTLLVKTLLKDWKNSFTQDELAELKQFDKESKAMNILMSGFDDGYYNGTRWFFNNDDLIKKNQDYHVMVNMASVRCDGIESAPHMADAYNFTTCDGMTLFQRNGREYMNILGSFDVLRAPGVTARIGMDKLQPITNWRGYCSKHNFAGGATFYKENAVAGFKFEKMNASNKKGVNDTVGRLDNNGILYGVQAYKSYFIFGDYMLALGAGVTNLDSKYKEDIHTTIEQTSKANSLYLLDNGKKKNIVSGVQPWGNSSDMKWLVQEGKFAYAVLPEYSSKAFYSLSAKEQNWVKMNPENKKIKTPAKCEVLQLWINHGNNPQDDKYGYVVYLGKGTPAAELPFKVLRNDTLVQAASSADGKVCEVVFYKAGEELRLVDGTTISSSAPCVVLLEKDGKKWNVAVTDPQQDTKLKSIDIILNKKKYVIDMPDGNQTGKCVTSIL